MLRRSDAYPSNRSLTERVQADFGQLKGEKQWETAGPTGECKAFGVNIFKYPWRNCGEKAVVTDPRHGVEKVFPVYEVEIGGTPHRFAGGEFSNGVFGVYLPEE